MTHPPQQPEGWGDPAYPAYPPAAHPTSGQPGYPPVSGPGYPPIPDPAGAYPQPAAYPTDKDAGNPYAAGYPVAPGYGGYGAWGTPRKTNGVAIASLIVSILGAFSLTCYGLGGVLGLVGAILGHVARRRIRANGTGGAGMALAGIIVGWVCTAIAVVSVAILISVLVASPSTTY